MTPPGDKESPSADELVLGVDGGGTQTVAILSPRDELTSNQVVGRGVAGPSNHLSIGAERAIQSLDRAIDAAFEAAQIVPDSVAAACLGLAGADRPADRALFTQWACQRRVARNVRIENDGTLLMAAGTPENWGLALIAGTGSLAIARTADGQTRRSGGWGYLFGDEGSGYAVALAGLQAVARAADGRGPTTMLTDAFLQALELTKPAGLIHAIYSESMRRAEIAELARLVFESSRAGDFLAHSIVVHSASELAKLVIAASKIFDRETSDYMPIAFGGGLFKHWPELKDEVVCNLMNQGLFLDPVTTVVEPAIGAVRLARLNIV